MENLKDKIFVKQYKKLLEINRSPNKHLLLLEINRLSNDYLLLKRILKDNHNYYLTPFMTSKKKCI